MALYSWFSRTTKKPTKKSVNVNSELFKASKSIKYMENYTMWPTVKIKPNVEVTLPNYDDLDNKKPKQPNTLLPTQTGLAVIKVKQA